MSATGRLGASEIGAAWVGILSEIGEIHGDHLALEKMGPQNGFKWRC
jgi:hypothetical protein